MSPTHPFVEFKKAEIEQSIPRRFEQQVERYPERLAVKTRGRALTYQALNELANRVAHTLLTHLGPGEEPVALLLEHDAPLIAAILGVLKAGKIYVPLDPAYPAARTAYMLADSRAGLIVTNDRLSDRAAELAEGAGQVLSVDEPALGRSAENPGLFISPDSYAGILYTSGSTGQPKGVVLNHRNVLHCTMTRTNACHFAPDDRLTLFQSCCFGGSLTPIFGALLNGAAVFPLDLKAEGSGQLSEWLVEQEITVFSGAVAFRQLLSTLSGRETFPKLRLICRSAEPLQRRDVERYQRYFSRDCVLVSSLAATEVLDFRYYLIDHDTRLSGSIAPAGYAVEDMEVLLLDQDGRPVGFNRVGEIAVKSRYLAPGYWRRPDLTRAAFRPDPSGGDERLYRTGDLGRMRPDGCLEILGRKDFQVKVRGYRIEVAEIELALLDLDGVKDAVVVAREAAPGEQRLVAYVVPGKQPGPTVGALRRHLQARLPGYMLPAVFVALEALPLTPNGKLDRLALPEPGRARPELDGPFVAPRGPVETMLAAIWAEVLGLERVGVDDEFLALGGDSLLATKLVSAVRDRLRVELPPSVFFQSPTVADQAAAIVQHLAEQDGASDTARLLEAVEALSEREAKARLREEGRAVPPAE